MIPSRAALLAPRWPGWFLLVWALAGLGFPRSDARDEVLRSPDVRGLTAVARPLDAAERSGEKLDAGGSAGLFVGVGRFDGNSGLADLRFTPDDAVALAHLFTLELRLLPAARVRIALSGEPRSQRGKESLAQLKAAGVIVGDAERRTLLDALDATVNLATASDGLLVVSFGSHGFEEKGTAYVMPSDGRRKYVGSTGVSLQLVKETLREAKANKRILLLDACRETLGGDVRGEGRMNDALRGALQASEGFAVLASCGAGQLSWEAPELEQGVFTHFLLEALRGGAGADAADGFIRLGDASAYATRATRQWVEAQKHEVQEPWFEGELARDIPLAVHPGARQRQDAAREMALKTETRRQDARRLLALAIADDVENQFPPATLTEVRTGLERVQGPPLEELLTELESLRENTPRNRRIFAQYWRDRRATLGVVSLYPPVPSIGPAIPLNLAGRSPINLAGQHEPTSSASPTGRVQLIGDISRFHFGQTSSTPLLDSLRLAVRATGSSDPAAATAQRPWTNSLGMPFVPVPGLKLVMCVWETRHQDFAAFAGRTLGVGTNWMAPDLNGHRVPNAGGAPVVSMSWADAQAFCAWLTRVERASGRIDEDQSYRLPTDLEWSRAVGLGNEAGATPADRAAQSVRQYPWGGSFPPPDETGNYRDTAALAEGTVLSVLGAPYDLRGYRDGYPTLAPVGSFRPNALGIHDLGGNVAELCVELLRPGVGDRVVRGAAWTDGAEVYLRSGARTGLKEGYISPAIGFRVVLSLVGGG